MPVLKPTETPVLMNDMTTMRCECWDASEAKKWEREKR